MRRAACLLGALLMAGEAIAGFDNWTIEATPDPFTGGSKVQVDYLSSMRSGAFLICDSAKAGIELRVVAGWQYVDDLKDFKAKGRVAVDGKILFEADGTPGAFGANVAGVSFRLPQEDATALALAMEGAKSQIAVQDGISEAPMLMKARGSTKAGKALRECLVKQAGGGIDSGGHRATGEQKAGDGRVDVVKQAMFMAHAKATEERCKDYRLRAEAKGYGDASSEQKEAIEKLIAEESGRTADDLREMSCAASAHETMKWTDLDYDKVWSAP